MSAPEFSSSVSASLDWDRDDRAAALSALSDARRRNRVAQLDKFDAFYKAYVSAIFGAVIVYALTGWLGAKAITEAQKADFTNVYPSYVAVVVAILIALGLRSGGRGGPLALERATVRHVMLAPVAREDILRTAARRNLFHSAFLGAVLGGVVGAIAARRLPDPYAVWVLVFAVFGLFVATGATACALVVSGLRMRAWLTDLIALLIVGWAIADAVLKHTTSPFAWLAHIATWPLAFDARSVIAMALVGILIVAGLYFARGWSLEVAERRSRLVGQLRFAATMQDVRTVMVLQRQLSQEHMRARPRMRIRPINPQKTIDAKGQPRVGVFIRRQAQSLMRWPLVRIIRPLILSIVTGFAAFGGWQVSPAMFVLCGLCLWLVALDFVEPLAQEADRPERLSLTKHLRGWVHLRLLIVPVLLQALAVAIAIATSVVLFKVAGAKLGDIAPFAVSTFSLAVLMPMAGAALVVSRPAGGPNVASLTPEITGLVTIWRAGFPPALAVGAFVPLVISQRDFALHGDIAKSLIASNMAWNIAFAVGLISFAWVRVGEQWRTRIQDATEEQKQTIAANQRKLEENHKQAKASK